MRGVTGGSDIFSEVSGFRISGGMTWLTFCQTPWGQTVTTHLKNKPLALSQTNTPENVKDNQTMARRWVPIRAGGLWLRAAARLTAPRSWLSEWQGCHGDQGAAAWGRTPAAEDLPMWRFLCVEVKGKGLLCAAVRNPIRCSLVVMIRWPHESLRRVIRRSEDEGRVVSGHDVWLTISSLLNDAARSDIIYSRFQVQTNYSRIELGTLVPPTIISTPSLCAASLLHHTLCTPSAACTLQWGCSSSTEPCTLGWFTPF